MLFYKILIVASIETSCIIAPPMLRIKPMHCSACDLCCQLMTAPRQKVVILPKSRWKISLAEPIAVNAAHHKCRVLAPVNGRKEWPVQAACRRSQDQHWSKSDQLDHCCYLCEQACHCLAVHCFLPGSRCAYRPISSILILSVYAVFYISLILAFPVGEVEPISSQLEFSTVSVSSSLDG